MGYLIDELDGQARAKAVELYLELEQAVIDNEIERASSIFMLARLSRQVSGKKSRRWCQKEKRGDQRPGSHRLRASGRRRTSARSSSKWRPKSSGAQSTSWMAKYAPRRSSYIRQLEQAVMDNEIERASSIFAKAKTFVTASVWQEIKEMIEQEEREARQPTARVAPAIPEAQPPDELYELLIDVGGLADELSGSAQAQAAKLIAELEQAVMDDAIDRAALLQKAKTLVTTRAWQERRRNEGAGGEKRVVLVKVSTDRPSIIRP